MLFSSAPALYPAVFGCKPNKTTMNFQTSEKNQCVEITEPASSLTVASRVEALRRTLHERWSVTFCGGCHRRNDLCDCRRIAHYRSFEVMHPQGTVTDEVDRLIECGSEYLTKIVEDLAIFVVHIRKSVTWTDVALAFANFIKLRIGEKALLGGFLDDLTEVMMSLLRHIAPEEVEMAENAQSIYNDECERREAVGANDVHNTVLPEMIQGYGETKFQKIVKAIKLFFLTGQGLKKTDDFQPQGASDNFLLFKDLLVNGFEDMTKLQNSGLWKKFRALLMACLSYGLFQSMEEQFKTNYFVKAYNHYFSGNPLKTMSLIALVLDFVVYLGRKGWQICKTGSIDCLYHDETQYGKWYTDCESIVVRMQYKNNPDDCPVAYDEHRLLADIESVIERGQDMMKYLDNHAADKKQLRNMLHNMQLMRAEFTSTQNAQQARPIPFSLLLYSKTGQGKTSLTDMIINHVGRIWKLPQGDEFIYTRNPAAEFWDGFSSSKWCCVMDDVAFRHPSQQGDTSCDEILQVINAVPYCPNQAHLDNKGRIPFRCKLVIATTNTEHINARFYYSNPSAVQRRFPFIIVPEVRPEYRDAKGMLDHTKVPEDPNGYPDFWTFTVKTVRPHVDTKQSAIVEVVPGMENVELKAFLVWLNSALQDHKEKLAKVANTKKALKEVMLCMSCRMPPQLCDCTAHVPQGRILSLGIAVGSVVVTGYAAYRASTAVEDLFVNLRRVRKAMKCVRAGINYWKHMGARVERLYLKTPKLLRYLVKALAIAGAAYGFYTYFAKELASQGSVQTVPKKDAEERTNVWYKAAFSCASFEVTPSTASCRGPNFENAVKAVMKNTVYVECFNEDETLTVKSRGLCLGGSSYIFANHTIPQWGKLKVVVVAVPEENVCANKTLFITEEQVVRFPTKDIAFVRLDGMPPKAALKCVATPSFNAQNDGFYLIKQKDGSTKRLYVNGAQKLRRTMKFKGEAFIEDEDVWIGAPKEATADGDCGSVLMLDTPQGPIVAGIHNAGSESKSLSSSIDTDFVAKALKHANPVVLNATAPTLNEASAEHVELIELSAKSTIRYTPQGVADVYGSLTSVAPRRRSRVGKTPICDYICERYGYQVLHAAPVLIGWSPWQHATVDLVNPVNGILQRDIDECVASLTADFLAGLDGPDAKRLLLEVYDEYTAVNGTPGVAYVDGLNRTTSAGYPYNRPKGQFLVDLPPTGDGNTHPVEVTEEIREQVRRIETKYLNGERNHTIFKAHLKDEPVTFAKRAAKKTRVFAGAPLAAVIHTRKYFLSFIRLIMNNRLIFESGPGTVSQSKEWGEIYRYLTCFGTNKIVAGDYKAFDKRMNSQMIIAAFQVLINLAKSYGESTFDEDDIRNMAGVATDTAFPTLDFNGDLIQFHGSNPSGHSLTTIVNGLVNSLYMRYTYLKLNPEHEVDSFRENVRLFTYGDDMICGVSDNAPWFNHTTIQQTLAGVDITYTMADKMAVSVPYIDIAEATFLKRTWRFEEAVGDYFCPLDEESITRALTIWVRSKTVSEKTQMVDVMRSMHMEYFFYGREVFEEKTAMFLDIIKKFDFEEYVSDDTFPAWEEYVMKWKLGSGLIKSSEQDFISL